jgi:hypothetical protein
MAEKMGPEFNEEESGITCWMITYFEASVLCTIVSQNPGMSRVLYNRHLPVVDDGEEPMESSEVTSENTIPSSVCTVK